MSQDSQELQFHSDRSARQTAAGAKSKDARVPADPERTLSGRFLACLLLAALAALCLAALLLLPAAREGAKLLANELFTASEAVNAYAYERFSVAANASRPLALLLLTLAIAAFYGIALLGKRHLTALLLAAGLMLAEVYFGLTLPHTAHILVFTALAAAFLWEKRSIGLWLSYLGLVLLLAVSVSLFLPGVHADLEARSEAWRDMLEQDRQTQVTADTKTQETALQGARHESRLDVTGDNAGENGDYELQTEYQHEIARPLYFNWIKTLLLMLAIILLLTLPFLPFLLAGERRKKALARRKAFLSPDDNEAVRAMFTHCAACIESCLGDGGNSDFALLPEKLGDGFGADYPLRCREAVGIWLEAAYSGRGVGSEKRALMRSFLDETEELMYDKADRKSRLRMKYLEYLFE